MRPSSKSRNRGRNSNRRGNNGGSVINRVFESAGPEGKVRGTPQQIIDKYISLAHDSQLSGDRVSAENFQQHAEHYSRILSEAQKELNEKQVESFNSNPNYFHRSDNGSPNNSKSDDLEEESKKEEIKKINIENGDIKNEDVKACSPKDEPENIQKKKSPSSKKDTLVFESKDRRNQTI
tara:strand:+ start:386 stop:922 length:537 start_codon:yes stop_codon:yes gene_type:complete